MTRTRRPRRTRRAKCFPLEKLPELRDELRDLWYRGSLYDRRSALGVSLGLNGLRVSEVCNLIREDFYPEADPPEVYVDTLKNGPTRTVEIGRTLAKAISDWRADRKAPTDPAAPLFPSRTHKHPRRDLYCSYARELFSRYAGYRLTFHAGRHTFAQLLLNTEHDVALVADKLGHAKLETSQVYAHNQRKVPAALTFDEAAERPALRLYIPPSAQDGAESFTA